MASGALAQHRVRVITGDGKGPDQGLNPAEGSTPGATEGNGTLRLT